MDFHTLARSSSPLSTPLIILLILLFSHHLVPTRLRVFSMLSFASHSSVQSGKPAAALCRSNMRSSRAKYRACASATSRSVGAPGTATAQRNGRPSTTLPRNRREHCASKNEIPGRSCTV